MNALVIAMLLGATAQVTGQMSPTSDVSSNRVKATGTSSSRALKDIAADVFGNVGSWYYVSTSATFASDSNPCLSWVFPCKTVLGAYAKAASGSTIWIADNSWVGGSVANQGLWIAGANDPQYGSLPSGWVQAKVLSFRGAGKTALQYALGTGANIIGGNGEGWSTNVDKPCLWVSGFFSSLEFRDLVFQGCSSPLRVGVASNNVGGVRTHLSQTANEHFYNVQFSNQSGVESPVAEIGDAFWGWYDQCVFNDVNHDLAFTDDRRAGILLKSSTTSNTGSWLNYFTQTRGSGSGLKYYVGSQSYSLTVKDYTLEGDGSYQLPPVVTVIGPWTTGQVELDTIQNADNIASAFSPAVLVTTLTGPLTDASLAHATLCNNCQSVQGPAVVTGIYGDLQSKVTGSPLTNGQLAIAWGRFLGSSDAPRRAGGPMMVSYANRLTTTDPPTIDPNIVYTSVAGPFRLTNAWNFSTAAGGTQNQDLSTYPTIAMPVGTRVVAGGWIRAPQGFSVSAIPDLTMITQVATITFDNGLNYIATKAQHRSTGAEWQFVSFSGTVTASSGGSPTINMYVRVDSSHSADIYQPFVYVIPAGDMTDDEFAEFRTYVTSSPLSAPAGVIASPRLSMPWSPGVTYSNLGSQPNGTGPVYCSDCTIANPCANGGTGAFAKRLNGAWICN